MDWYHWFLLWWLVPLLPTLFLVGIMPPIGLDWRNILGVTIGCALLGPFLFVIVIVLLVLGLAAQAVIARHLW